MSEFQIEPFFDRRQLNRIVMQWKEPQKAILNLFFQEEDVSDKRHVEIGFFDGKRRLAPFVRRRATGQSMEALKESRFVYTPPYMKPKIGIEPEDIQKAINGADPLGARTAVENMAELVARNSKDLDDSITRTEEWMATNAITQRKIEILDENGVEIQDDIVIPIESDFDFQVTETWGTGSSDPLEDQIEARRRIARKTGLNADIAIHGSASAKRFRQSNAVRQAIRNQWSDRGRYVAVAQNFGLIFLGIFDGIENYEYAEWLLNPVPATDGSHEEIELVPEDICFLGSTEARSVRHYGAIESFGALSPLRRYLRSIPPDNKDPEIWELQEHSAPLPYPHQPYGFCNINTKQA